MKEGVEEVGGVDATLGTGKDGLRCARGTTVA